ncbi:MAG TPA: hypothetical protein VE957_21655 [Terriglobales bacterium]|nr:hypothetical protein [Terriglobales bacterium]
MPFFHSPQPNLRISAEPASLTRLSPLLALLIAIASLTPAWGQSAASARAKPTEPARFTVAAPPPEGENAYCDKGDVAKFGAKDGPAELPKTCYYTGLDGTPSPGKQIRVGANSDLAEALEGANCGDTLLLAAGASFPIKQFPAKNCDDRHYIIVRTDTSDSKLPPEGTRISPAWGGVASLPGRPPYAQPAGGAAKLMATIVVKPETGVEFGDHYRFIGIEWVPLEGRKIARLLFTNGGDHLIFDRNWVHGTDGIELGHGLGIHGSPYVAVIHSYFNSFTCTAGKGSCTDATAIGGGNGDLPTHTVKIVDNFLESSGQNIFLGGAAASVRPEDFEIRRNHLFKPTFWNRSSPDHQEPTPIVKNLFELKNARRLLFEANYLENSWGGFSQVGPAIVLTPRNNVNKATGQVTCPDCAVTDVTIRYIWVRKVNQVLQIANPMDRIKPAPGNSYSIHDIVAEGLGYPECGRACGGALNHLSGPIGGSPKDSTMHDIVVDHITFIPMKEPKDLMILGGPPQADPNDQPRMYNITWTNTIADVGGYGMWPMGGSPEQNCSYFPGATPKTRIEACWKGNSAFLGNVLAGGAGIRGQSPVWPEGNPIVGSLESVGFVNLNHGLDGDYHLAAKSKLKGKATDGRDPGADVDAVLAGIRGVR